jgi:hypothetical protein
VEKADFQKYLGNLGYQAGRAEHNGRSTGIHNDEHHDHKSVNSGAGYPQSALFQKNQKPADYIAAGTV